MVECREWRGAVDKKGYGRRNVKRDGKWQNIPVHRWVMAQVVGWDALHGKVVMHVCDNPPCFRLDHLRIGTVADNQADMQRKRRGTVDKSEKRRLAREAALAKPCSICGGQRELTSYNRVRCPKSACRGGQ